MRETARIEFKDYRFDEVAQSIDYDENDRLKKTISGFLNGEGGIIYLPIKEYVL